jgi:hypothetical protein
MLLLLLSFVSNNQENFYRWKWKRAANPKTERNYSIYEAAAVFLSFDAPCFLERFN